MAADTWYTKLGFYHNPFSMKPAAFHDELFGYGDVVERLNEKISAGEIAFIEGKYGSGKTTILKRIINRFEGRKKLIYYSRNRSEESVDFDGLLRNRSWWSRLFRIRPRDMILLIDEAQDLNKKDLERIREYHEAGYFKSVVFVSDSMKNARFSSEFRKLVQGNLIRIGKISEKDAIELVRKRIGNISLLSDAMIRKIYTYDATPRTFLKNCEDVCKYAISEGDTAVSEKHIRAVL